MPNTPRFAGYKVYSVSSGELAIEFIKKKPVDLMVLDMLMEPGMSGRETYEEAVKLNPAQKAVIVSGFSKSEDVEAAIALGASAFIKKPYTSEQLVQAVKDVLTP